MLEDLEDFLIFGDLLFLEDMEGFLLLGELLFLQTPDLLLLPEDSLEHELLLLPLGGFSLL